jgi:hypothetical protein
MSVWVPSKTGTCDELPSNSLAHDLEITQIERDQEKITNCAQMWAADVCPSRRGKAESIGFDDVVYMSYTYCATGIPPAISSW